MSTQVLPNNIHAHAPIIAPEPSRAASVKSQVEAHLCAHAAAQDCGSNSANSGTNFAASNSANPSDNPKANVSATPHQPPCTSFDAPEVTFDSYTHCELCPRCCKAPRNRPQAGYCGCSNKLYIARAALHYWEEPPISGKAGSGAIFFTGCPLRCVFCQNLRISQEGYGKQITTARLAEIMLELQQQGALNINLVTPLHYAPHVRTAICMAKEAGLQLPIVCNTSGYEKPETVAAMADVIDIWLPDMKFYSPKLASALLATPNYPEYAQASLAVMLKSLRRKGGRKIEAKTGRMLQGIIVRHLVMPGHTDDSWNVLRTLWNMGHNEIDVSIMNQYTPNRRCRKQGGNLSHTLSNEEYESVLDYADGLGFEHMWWQQGGTVSESFIPEFDATGVVGKELVVQNK